MPDRPAAPDPRQAVIVCPCVAVHGRPALRAVRDEPIDDSDSGWQLLCGVREHDNSDNSDAQVWAVQTLLEREPGLTAHLASPWPATVFRTSANAAWMSERNR